MNKEYFKLGSKEEQKEKMAEMARLARNTLGIAYCENCMNSGQQGWDLTLNQFIPCSKCVIKAAEVIRNQKIEEINKVQNPEGVN